ncbi:MAG TPA: ABC transporter ATP-binding protein, partial [Polyangiaceae bacterium]|nr:ABC transporter ATP-binding protein [Polyangiaceae bacterium]
GIIGPNGAGKSTLFHVIAGHLQPNSGRVLLRGEAIERLRPEQRAARGLGIVYQGARIFRGLTVRENIMVGAHCTARHGFFDAALRSPRCRREEKAIRARADAVLEQVGLVELGDRMAESLPLGQQRAMQLGTALAANPAVLLLDEPASGLRSAERRQFARLLRDLCSQGMTLLLVEHDVALVTSLSDKITVLDLGCVIAEGSPAEIRADPRVIAAYLGTVEDEPS